MVHGFQHQIEITVRCGLYKFPAMSGKYTLKNVMRLNVPKRINMQSVVL
jgi:hypothetical protein